METGGVLASPRVVLPMTENVACISVRKLLSVLVPSQSELRAKQGVVSVLIGWAPPRRSEAAVALRARCRHRSLSV